MNDKFQEGLLGSDYVFGHSFEVGQGQFPEHVQNLGLLAVSQLHYISL